MQTLIQVDFSLPVPPSVNNAYVNVTNRWTGNSKGRSLSRDAKLWKQSAGVYLMQWKERHREALKRISLFDNISYRVNYEFHFKNKGKRDIANYEKLISDFLVENFYYRDDSLIDRMTLIRGEINPEGLVNISIQALCL